MNELHRSVAQQLMEVETKEEFEKLLNYHYGQQLDKYKKQLEEQGVDLKRFEKKIPVVVDKINKKENEKNRVNLEAITKMIIDEPLVEEGE